MSPGKTTNCLQAEVGFWLLQALTVPIPGISAKGKRQAGKYTGWGRAVACGKGQPPAARCGHWLWVPGKWEVLGAIAGGTQPW